jgi:membrane protein required for colicin V production
MSPLDVLLVVLLVAFAARGWWRGFCRETLGLAGLFGGVLAAAAAGPQLAAALLSRRLLPPELALVAAWAALFLGTWLLASLVGRLADRLARALFLGSVNRFAGALFGSAKGAALLGFVLLLAEHLLPSPALSKAVAASRLGRPLEQIAGSVVATGRELGAAPPERRA